MKHKNQKGDKNILNIKVGFKLRWVRKESEEY